MKKYLHPLLYLFFFCTHINTQAQIRTFDVIIINGINRYNEAYDIIALPDTSYVIANNYINTLLGFQGNGLEFLRVDAKGNLLVRKQYSIPQNGLVFDHRQGTLIPTPDGHLIYRTIKNGEGKGNPYFMKFTVNGDTLWTKEHHTATIDAIQTIRNTKDGGFIISGVQKPPGTSQGGLYIMKTDSLTNILWTQTHSVTDTFKTSTSIEVDSINGGGYIVGGKHVFENEQENIWVGHGAITKLDEMGNIVWEKVYRNNFEDNCLQYIKPHPLGGYISWGCQYWYASESGLRWLETYFVERLNAAGDTLWQHKLNQRYDPKDYYINNIEILEDNSLLVIGQIRTNEAFYGWLRKYDEQGNILWDRQYDHIEPMNNNAQPGFENYIASYWEGFYNATPTLDGGLMAVGYIIVRQGNSDLEEIWLVKLDSMGCLHSNCQDTILVSTEDLIRLPHPSAPLVQVYPNPASTVLQIDIPEVLPIKNLQLAIFDLTGRLIQKSNLLQQQTKIDVRQLPDGMYLYHIQQEGKTIHKDKLLIVR